MVESLVFGRGDIVNMLFRSVRILLGLRHPICARLGSLQDLLGLQRLYGRVVVILVYLLVDGCGHILVLMGTDLLFGDSLSDSLVDCRLLFPVMGNDLGNGLLGFLHCC